MQANIMLRNKYKWNLIFIFVMSIFLLSCTQNEDSRIISTLNVAVLPDQRTALLHEKYLPFFVHLKEHTQLSYELLIPESYEQLLEWFNDKKIDLALFGGATYVKAHLRSNATPLVMRDVDGQFRSSVIIRQNNPATNLKDLKGASFAFGSRLSTSGHFMPRHFFQDKGIVAESFFSNIEHSGAHDRTVEWVRDGKVDAGVVHSGILNEMILDGRLKNNEIKTLWESPSYADYVWAIQSDINEEQKIILRDVFLHINQDVENKEILKNLGANYFIPASHDDFKNLEAIILQMESPDKDVK